MASIILKWLRRCLFICVCAVFLMSHNAGAISDEVNWVNSGYNNINVYANDTLSCQTNCDFVVNNNADNSVGVQRIQFGIQSGQYYKNQIIQFNLSFWKVSSNTSIHANFNSLQVVDNANLKFYDLTFDNIDSNSFIAHIYIKVVNDTYISNRVQVEGVGSLFMFLLQPSERVSANSWTLWQVIDMSVDTNSIVNAIQQQPNYQQTLNNIRNDIQDVSDAIENQNQEEQEAVQDAADEAATSGDQSAEDAENATAGLISVIGGFVNAITTAQPSNCKINGKITNTFNMGELDLCSMPVPPFVQIISSLILIAICIPFAIVMFNRFIGLFRSFQG